LVELLRGRGNTVTLLGPETRPTEWLRCINTTTAPLISEELKKTVLKAVNGEGEENTTCNILSLARQHTKQENKEIIDRAITASPLSDEQWEELRHKKHSMEERDQYNKCLVQKQLAKQGDDSDGHGTISRGEYEFVLLKQGPEKLELFEVLSLSDAWLKQCSEKDIWRRHHSPVFVENPLATRSALYKVLLAFGFQVKTHKCTYEHTHIHTHTHTHTHTYTQTHKCTCEHTHTCTHTH
jgi:hypothetical protein